MKKLFFIGLGLLVIGASSCSKGNDPRSECLHCTGCFNSWTECKEDYEQNEQHPYTWQQYVDSTIAQNQYSTNQCHMVE